MKKIKSLMIVILIIFSNIAKADCNVKVGTKLWYILPSLSIELNDRKNENSFTRIDTSLAAIGDLALIAVTDFQKVMILNSFGNNEINAFLGPSALYGIVESYLYSNQKTFLIEPLLKFGIEIAKSFDKECILAEFSLYLPINNMVQKKEIVPIPIIAFKYIA